MAGFVPAILAGVRMTGSSNSADGCTQDGWSSETDEPCHGVDGRDKPDQDAEKADQMPLS
jgi:hypothetical protein